MVSGHTKTVEKQWVNLKQVIQNLEVENQGLLTRIRFFEELGRSLLTTGKKQYNEV